MIKYRVSAIIRAEEDYRDEELWKRFGYKQKKPYISDDGIVAYKITAGLYIFYISQIVYDQGVSLGIIEPVDSNVVFVDFSDMLCSRGLVCYHRIGYALEHSTPGYLKSELERLNSEGKILQVVQYHCHWWKNEKRLEHPLLTYVGEVVVDLENRKILKNTVDKTLPFKERQFISPLYRVDTYDELLDALVSEQDRSFCNSRHIIDKFADTDFYSTDHFLTRQDKYEFTYITKGCEF